MAKVSRLRVAGLDPDQVELTRSPVITEVTVSASCKPASINLTHSGKLPAASMTQVALSNGHVTLGNQCVALRSSQGFCRKLLRVEFNSLLTSLNVSTTILRRIAASVMVENCAKSMRIN